MRLLLLLLGPSLNVPIRADLGHPLMVVVERGEEGRWCLKVNENIRMKVISRCQLLQPQR